MALDDDHNWTKRPKRRRGDPPRSRKRAYTDGLHLKRDERRALELHDPRVTAYKAAFLVAYVETATLTRACAAVGITYGTMKDWLDDARSEKPIDQAFAKAFALAKDEACDNVEGEITRRGMHGIDEPVVAQGELVFQPHLKKTGEPLYYYRLKDTGELFVPDPETGERLEQGADYVIRPLTVKRYSDKLLLARARALMPERYGYNIPGENKPSLATQKPEDVNDAVIEVSDEVAATLEKARRGGHVH